MYSDSELEEESTLIPQELLTFDAKVIGFDTRKVVVMLDSKEVIQNYQKPNDKADEGRKTYWHIEKIFDGKEIANNNSESQIFHMTNQQILGNSLSVEASENLFRLINKEAEI